jgi:hypothetical protein
LEAVCPIVLSTGQRRVAQGVVAVLSPGILLELEAVCGLEVAQVFFIVLFSPNVPAVVALVCVLELFDIHQYGFAFFERCR